MTQRREAGQRTIAVVAAGNMGEALMRGLLTAAVVTPAQLRVSDAGAARRTFLDQSYGITSFASNAEAVRDAALVIVAVKPQVIDGVLDEIATALHPRALVISVVAGWETAAIAARLPEGQRVVRAMPNVAALVRASATAIAAGPGATEEDLARVRQIFDAVGVTVIVHEALMDAVTGLSGSGPAYIFMVIEALADAGVKVGLSRADAHLLACQTVLGAARLTIDSGEHPGKLKDMVCSPGGTTIAAVSALEKGGLRSALISAVEAAAQRSRELR